MIPMDIQTGRGSKERCNVPNLIKLSEENHRSNRMLTDELGGSKPF